MDIRLNDSELKVMNVLWRQDETLARDVAAELTGVFGWNANTTYTLIKRLVKKGAVERREPGFACRVLVSKEQVQRIETDSLIEKLYDGSVDKLFAALLGGRRASPEEIRHLREMIDAYEE